MIPPVDIRAGLDRAFPGREVAYHELAAYFLPAPLGLYLDYGCGNLHVVRAIAGRYQQAHGVDVKPPVGPLPERFAFTLLGTRQTLPFADETFDVAAIVEVIEHVPDERAVLTEIARVLKPGGRFVLTTPHKGLLTWVDPGNWKYYFPTFHRWAHVHVFRDREGYERRFGARRPAGLFGDISGTRHKHYAIAEITALFPRDLAVRAAYVSYPAMRLLWVIGIVGRLCPGAALRERLFGCRGLRCWLSRRFGASGDQLVLIAEKLTAEKR